MPEPDPRKVFSRARSCGNLPGMKSTLTASSPSLVAVVLTCLLSGCAGSGLTTAQQADLDQGLACYERNDYGRALAQLDRFLGEVEEGPEVAQALYIRGLCNAQLGRRSSAYADLHRCAELPTDTDIAWRNYIVLGTLYFEDEKWVQAAQSLRAAADRMPNAPPKDFVLFRLGLCHERMGQWQAALGFFGEIPRLFTSGAYLKAAQRRLRIKASHHAVQCGAFGEKANAQKLVTDLEQQGLEPYIFEETRGRAPLYVVLVGKYQSYDDVRGQLSMIKQHFVDDALLWP